jgi:hypothetical protein
MIFNSAQDVLDEYYKQKPTITYGVKNPDFKSLVSMIEDYGHQKYEEGFKEGEYQD